MSAILRGIDLRVGTEADDDVGAGAGVGDDGGLRADVLPAQEVDADGDAGRVGVFLGVLAPEDFVGVDELGGSQDAEFGALFQLVFQWLDVGCGHVGHGGAGADEGDGRRCDGGGGEREGLASADGHVLAPYRSYSG